MSREIFFRLWTRAPRIEMKSSTYYYCRVDVPSSRSRAVSTREIPLSAAGVVRRFPSQIAVARNGGPVRDLDIRSYAAANARRHCHPVLSTVSREISHNPSAGGREGRGPALPLEWSRLLLSCPESAA